LSDIITPGENAVALSPELAKQIKRHFKKDRDNRFDLFLLSHAIREKYLNAETGEYTPEFKAFYEQHSLESVYGKLANFSKYASAGSVVEYVKSSTSNPQKYLNQLPVSQGSLYEISLILKLDEEALKACWHMTPRRKSITDKKYEWGGANTAPLIRPDVGYAELFAWRKRWEEPEVEKEEDKHRRNVKLLTLSVSEDIFKFDAVGNKEGSIDLEEVVSLLSRVQALLNKDNEKQFRLDSQIERIQERYEAAKKKNDPMEVLKGTSKGSTYKND